MNSLELLDLELEYDLIEKKDSDILSSNDIQNDILNLVKLAENVYLYTLTPEQIFKNPDASLVYREFDSLARNIFNYVDVHSEYLILIIGLIKCMRHQEGFDKRLLSYCLLDIFSEYYPNLANELFLIFVKSVGCWKDLKYFYLFTCEIGKEYTSSVVEYSIQLANEELRNNSTSNVAKWIPREKTKYKKLYERLVINYFKDDDYFKYDGSVLKDPEKKKKAMNKAKMEYRKILSKLNKQLDTVQIKQCSKQWQKIDPNKQTSRTLELQINAFLNLSRDSNKIRHELSDRIICAQNFIDTNLNKSTNLDETNKIVETNKINKINTFNELVDLINEYYCNI